MRLSLSLEEALTNPSEVMRLTAAFIFAVKGCTAEVIAILKTISSLPPVINTTSPSIEMEFTNKTIVDILIALNDAEKAKEWMKKFQWQERLTKQMRSDDVKKLILHYPSFLGVFLSCTENPTELLKRPVCRDFLLADIKFYITFLKSHSALLTEDFLTACSFREQLIFSQDPALCDISPILANLQQEIARLNRRPYQFSQLIEKLKSSDHIDLNDPEIREIIFIFFSPHASKDVKEELKKAAAADKLDMTWTQIILLSCQSTLLTKLNPLFTPHMSTWKNSEWNTTLMYAVRAGASLDTIKFLVNDNPQSPLANDNPQSPLIDAAIQSKGNSPKINDVHHLLICTLLYCEDIAVFDYLNNLLKRHTDYASYLQKELNKESVPAMVKIMYMLITLDKTEQVLKFWEDLDASGLLNSSFFNSTYNKECFLTHACKKLDAPTLGLILTKLQTLAAFSSINDAQIKRCRQIIEQRLFDTDTKKQLQAYLSKQAQATNTAQVTPLSSPSRTAPHSAAWPQAPLEMVDMSAAARNARAAPASPTKA